MPLPYFEYLKTRLIARPVSFGKVAADVLLVYVDAEGGEQAGLTFWFDHPWRYVVGEDIALASDQLVSPPPDLDDDADDPEEIAEEALSRLVGRTIVGLDMDPERLALVIALDEGHRVETGPADPESPEIWHIRENQTGLRLSATHAGLAIVPHR